MFQKVTVLSLQGYELTAPDQRSIGRGSPRRTPHYMKKVDPIVAYDWVVIALWFEGGFMDQYRAIDNTHSRQIDHRIVISITSKSFFVLVSLNKGVEI